eukprot:TRINITY_DN616_c0_g2_i1.p2 TRINITY_DN616_c0_g2~~TRINITY_DN616_c0_g2_i1.p2  ORF type:complete len:474 (+),score=108.32 TRINITY_DN616_c0_g2_i1:10636-12057(+)
MEEHSKAKSYIEQLEATIPQELENVKKYLQDSSAEIESLKKSHAEQLSEQERIKAQVVEREKVEVGKVRELIHREDEVNKKLQEEHGKVQELIVVAKKVLEDGKAMIEKLRTKKAELEKLKRDKIEDAKLIQDASCQMEKEMNTLIKQHGNELASVINAEAVLTISISEQDESISKLIATFEEQKEIKRAIEERKALVEKIDKIENEKELNSERIKQAQAQHKELLADYSKLEEEVQNVKPETFEPDPAWTAKLEELQEKINETNQEISALESSLQQSRMSSAQYEKTIADKNAELKRIMKANQEAVARIEEKNKQAEMLNHLISELKEKEEYHETLQAEYENKHKELVEMDTKIHKLRVELEEEEAKAFLTSQKPEESKIYSLEENGEKDIDQAKKLIEAERRVMAELVNNNERYDKAIKEAAQYEYNKSEQLIEKERQVNEEFNAIEAQIVKLESDIVALSHKYQQCIQTQ